MDRRRCELLAKEAGPNAIAAAGETSIGELIALLSLCDGFVGNDTGVTLLAGVVGLPTVGIFGSTNPAGIGPVWAKDTPNLPSGGLQSMSGTHLSI